MIQRSYSGFLPILAVGSPSLSDASLMKTFTKPLRTIHQNAFFTTSLRTLVLNNGAQPEQYLRSYINYLRLNLVWFSTLYLAIVKLVRRFPRHFPNSGQSLQQPLQTHWLETQFVYLMPLMNVTSRNNWSWSKPLKTSVSVNDPHPPHRISSFSSLVDHTFQSDVNLTN